MRTDVLLPNCAGSPAGIGPTERGQWASWCNWCLYFEVSIDSVSALLRLEQHFEGWNHGKTVELDRQKSGEQCATG